MKIARTVGVASRRPRHASYDVVVVGARAAGAATAMLLARCGHRVLMVDRSRRGSDTVSTHTLLRTAVLQLDRWGLLGNLTETDTPPIRQVTLGFGDQLIPISLSSDFGVRALYAPRRTVLDPMLQASAEEAGVEFYDQVRLVNLTRDPDGRVNGVGIEVDGSHFDVPSRYVVGADGVRSWTAKLVDAASYHEHPATNSIRYGYFVGPDIEGLQFQFTPGTTSGLIPTNDGSVCAYLGLPMAIMKTVRTENAFRSHMSNSHLSIAQWLGSATRIGAFHGTAGLPGFLRNPWGPGWALVGDAGYTKDPVSAHGLSAALRDAELCARAIDSALIDPGSTTTALTRYHLVRDQLSGRMLDLTSALASYDWDAGTASQLMRDISDSVKDECTMITELGDWRAISSPSIARTSAAFG